MMLIYVILVTGIAFSDANRVKRPLLVRGPLRTISDRITPGLVQRSEESVLPRERRSPVVPVLKDQVEAMKIRNLLRQPRGSFPKLPRVMDDDVMERLDDSAERRFKLQKMAHEYSRSKRISSSQASRKSVPIPASFLSAAARIVVPAQPEQGSPARTSMIPESGSKSKLEEAKRSMPY